MRGYSLRSSFPLARSSQDRRRLILLYNLNAQEPPQPDAEEDFSAAESTPEPAVPALWESGSMEPDNAGTLDSDERRRLDRQETAAVDARETEADQFAEDRAFLDEIFHESEARNEALASGNLSESVLDDDEDEHAHPPMMPLNESLISSSGEESIILSGNDDESRIFSMEDLREQPLEEMPGSAANSDRKPHYPSWYVPNFKTIKRLLAGDKPVTWMFAGESAASAADLAQGRRNFTDHFSERIRTELGRMLDVVVNTGNTDETCAKLLKNLEWRVLRFHPEVVSLLLGRKDSERGPAGREEFQAGLEQIVQMVRDAGSILVLHTPNRIDTTRAGHLADLPGYVEIIQDVAQSYNIPLVDHWEHWTQQKPDTESLRTWLSADGVLPGVYGQREMAKLIFHRFEIFDPNSPICNARVP